MFTKFIVTTTFRMAFARNETEDENADLPIPPTEFLSYVERNPQSSVHELVLPFNQHEQRQSTSYAIDVFSANNPEKVRFRRSLGDTRKYLCRLPDPKPDGQAAIVQSLSAFRTNFNAFTNETFRHFTEPDWSNIVVAGGSVSICLHPLSNNIPDHKKHYLDITKGDIDIFFYDMCNMTAQSRLLRLEEILCPKKVIRTQNAVTFISEYPQRPIQVILQLFRSISEIITSFDVNSSCVAYNGQTVFAAPRG